MLTRPAAILFAAFVLLVVSCKREDGLSQLRERIADRLAAEKGTFAVALHDMNTGKELFLNQGEVFHAASTMKTPVLIEIYRQANLGALSLKDSLVVKNEFRSIVDSSLYQLHPGSDSDTSLYSQIGQKVALEELLYKMIIRSSNLATNTVIALAGAENVTRTMRRMGANDIQVLRGVEDIKAFEQGLSNTTTAYDLMVIYKKIAAGEAVSPDASRAMIDILLDQQFNEIIPARLPAGVKVAHKTGSISGVRHDSGIVFLPGGGSYVLVLLSKDLEDTDRGVAAMADVSEMIYQFITAR